MDKPFNQFNKDDFDPSAINDRARDEKAARDRTAREQASMDQVFASARNFAMATALFHRTAFLDCSQAEIYTREECLKIATDAMQSWTAGFFLMASREQR